MLLETLHSPIENTPTSAQELAELTGIPESQITPEQIDKYDLAKSIDANLDLVAVKAEIDIAQKIVSFNALLEESDNIDNSPSRKQATVPGIDFSNLSIDEIRIQAEQGLAGAQEALDRQTQAGLSRIENTMRTQVSESFLGKIIPESVLDWIMKTGREKAEGNVGMIQGWLLSLVIGFIPGAKMIMNGYEKFFGEGSGDTEDSQETGDENKNPETNIDQEADISGEESNTDGIESSEILTKRSAVRDAGYRIMIQISGIDYGEGNSTPGIYEELSNESIFNLQASLGRDLPESSLFNEDDIRLSIIGISGPIVKSLLDDRISQGEIRSILGMNDGNFNELAHVYFSNEELAEIRENSGNYGKLPISITSRLLALSYRETIAGISQMAVETRSTVAASFTNALFSPETYTSLQGIFESDSVENDIYPDGMARALSNNLGIDSRTATREQIIGQDTISENDMRHLDNFILFRDGIFPYIQENFGLGLENFAVDLNASVENGAMIGLYLALRGKSVGEISESDAVIIYAWIYNILPAGPQGEYTARMMREIAEGFSEGRENHVMTAVLFRISQYDREMTLNGVEKTLSLGDRAIMDQVESVLPEAFAGNSLLLRIATWAVEIGGFTLLMKLLFKMPVMRAVLIATSGVAGASIYFGLKEGIYNSLNSDVQDIYDNYIDLLLQNEALGDNTKESLMSGINDNTIGYMQIVGWISATNFSEIAAEALT